MSCKLLICVFIFLIFLEPTTIGSDVPVYYDGSDFQTFETVSSSEEFDDNFTLSSPGDGFNFFTGVPVISQMRGDSVITIAEEIKSSIDPENPIVHNKAREIAANSAGAYNIGQICFVYEYLKDNWRYVADPRGIEYFSSGSETIQNAEGVSETEIVAGIGDCDDYAILMSSLLESIGGTTRIVLAYGSKGGHAYTEVYVGSIEKASTKNVLRWLQREYHCENILGHLYEEDGSFWLNMDWNGTHPGGQLYKSEKQYIAFVRDEYASTEVGLPPNYGNQDPTGLLMGTVTDTNGHPLVSIVTATNVESGKSYPCSVDISGEVKLELPIGNYEIVADKSGYSFDQEQIMVLENVDISVDLIGSIMNRPNIWFDTEAIIDKSKRTVYYFYDGGHQLYKVRFSVNGPDVNRIKSVKYSLHETFEDPEHITMDASNDFEMICWLWGSYPMPIIVTTKEGNEYEYVYQYSFGSQLRKAQQSGYQFKDITNSYNLIERY